MTLPPRRISFPNSYRRYASLTLSALFAAALVAPSSARASDGPLAARVDALFLPWNKSGSPGCAVGVMKQGELIQAKGYGMADIEHSVALSADSVFNIGSMAKQFTAASVGLLVLDGKLSLEQDARKSFPGLQLASEPISVGELIHHESGL